MPPIQAPPSQTLPPSAQCIAAAFGPLALPALLDGLAASDMAIGIFDPADGLHFSCAAFREIFDIQDGPQSFSSIMRHCHAAHRGPLIEAGDIDLWLAAANTRRRASPLRKFEIDLCDGRWMWATETTYNDGWIMLVLQDFTVLKVKQISLEQDRDAALQAADTDPLTLLANRRAAMRYLENGVASASDDRPLTVALIDIDHFKHINDGHGHDAGDEVLRHFGRVCRHIFRNSDRMGRVGGEEFLLIMPQTALAEALMAVQRFRIHLNRANQLLPKPLSFTVSAGVAQWTCGESPNQLYKRTDAALYRAKAEGRDRVTCAAAP